MTTEQGVELEVPAEPAFAALVRLTAANLAAQNGFVYDQVEDVRMAAGEAVRVLLGLSADAYSQDGRDRPWHETDNRARLRATFTVSDDDMAMTTRLIGSDRKPVVSDLSEQVLEATTGAYAVDDSRPGRSLVDLHFEKETDGES